MHIKRRHSWRHVGSFTAPQAESDKLGLSPKRSEYDEQLVRVCPSLSSPAVLGITWRLRHQNRACTDTHKPPAHLDDDALTPVLLLKAAGEEIHKGLHTLRRSVRTSVCQKGLITGVLVLKPSALQTESDQYRVPLWRSRL